MKTEYTLSDLLNWPEATADLTKPARLSVFGDPIKHSLSPQMHNPGLAAAEIDAEYIRLHIAPDELETALRELPKQGFYGTNVTIPHKADVARIVDEVTEVAKRTGAVNTVKVEPETGSLIGHSTDGPGFERAIEEAFGVKLEDLRILILGAGGGAGRAVAVQCALAGCPKLVLANRTVSKVESLKSELDDLFEDSKSLQVVGLEDAIALSDAVGEVDLIVNGTSIGMKDSDARLISASDFESRHLVYDMIYAPPKTQLILDAEASGARAANGLSMLLWQGALAFEFWFDLDAPVDAMREGLMSVIS